MYTLALLRQYEPLPDKFEDGDELWIVQAIVKPYGLSVGYVTIKLNKLIDPIPMIDYVYVDSKHRKKGIAKLLIKFVIKQWNSIDITGDASEEGKALISWMRNDPEISSKIRKEY